MPHITSIKLLGPKSLKPAMAHFVAESTNKATVVLLPLAILLLLLLTAAVHGKVVDDGCIRRVGDTPVPGSCLCYDRCARKGGDKAGLMDAHAQSCFVDCVLKDGGWDALSPAAVVPVSPRTLVPEVLLSKTVRLAVTRPRVSRSREEKEEMEEVLVVELGFQPEQNGFMVHVFLNLPEGGETQFTSLSKKYNHRYADTFVAWTTETAGKDRLVRKFPVGGKLEALEADGDETVVVSLVPFVFEDARHPYWYERQTVVVRSVRVVYEPKKLYLTSDSSW